MKTYGPLVFVINTTPLRLCCRWICCCFVFLWNLAYFYEFKLVEYVICFSMNTEVEFHIRNNYAWIKLPQNVRQVLSAHTWAYVCLVRYDTRYCFNVHSKADMSQLNLPHGTNN